MARKKARGFFRRRRARATQPLQESLYEGIPAQLRWWYPLLFIAITVLLFLWMRRHWMLLEIRIYAHLAQFLHQVRLPLERLAATQPLWHILCPSALLIGSLSLFGLLMREWAKIYATFILPTQNKRERERVRRYFNWYTRGRHGPAYLVMYGQRIDTYIPPRSGPQLVVLDSASAMITYNELEGGRWQVHGPGIHFLTSRHRVEAFCDLREHGFLISGDFENHPALVRIGNIGAAADIFLMVYLENFDTAGMRAEEKALAEGIWASIYNTTIDQLRSKSFTTTPYYGHPESIRLNFEKLRVEAAEGNPVTLQWWEPARRIAIELWQKLVDNHNLFDLFPSAVTLEEQLEKDPHFRTGMERIAEEFRARLTSPIFDDDKGNKSPSREFRRLAEFGLRVRVASIVRVHLEEKADQLLYYGYISPWQRYVREHAASITQLQHYIREAAETEAANEWLKYLVARIRQHPEVWAVLEPYISEESPQSGMAGSVDFDNLSDWSILAVLLDAWEDVMRRPDLSNYEEHRALERLRRWWALHQGDNSAFPGSSHGGWV